MALSGEIDLVTGPAMLDAILAAVPGETNQGGGVVVDFAHVDFVGAAGFNTLVAARNHLRGHGAKIVVRSPTRLLTLMLDLFELTVLVEAPTHNGTEPP